MSDPRHQRGERGEAAAARALRRRGYRIVERNWRCNAGEIDLVARHRGDLVVVEVKARRSADWGAPELAVGPAKQRKLSRLLDVYLAEKDLYGVNCRFDVVALLLDERGRVRELEVYENAFGYLD